MNYYHMVFSVPHTLVPLIWQNQKLLFALLFDASAATLLEVAADPKHLGAEIGFLSILHTWGQSKRVKLSNSKAKSWRICEEACDQQKITFAK